jgi:hypothetical protein
LKSRTSLARDTAEEAAQEHWPRELRRGLKHEFQVPQRRAKCVAHCNNGPFTQLQQGAGSERLDVNFREVVHSVLDGNADVARPKRFAEDRLDMHKNARLTPKA